MQEPLILLIIQEVMGLCVSKNTQTFWGRFRNFTLFNFSRWGVFHNFHRFQEKPRFYCHISQRLLIASERQKKFPHHSVPPHEEVAWISVKLNNYEKLCSEEFDQTWSKLKYQKSCCMRPCVWYKCNFVTVCLYGQTTQWHSVPFQHKHL